MLSFDQLNLGQLSSAELLGRLILQMHQATKRNPKNPDFRGTDLMAMSTLDSSGGALSGEFAYVVVAGASLARAPTRDAIDGDYSHPKGQELTALGAVPSRSARRCRIAARKAIAPRSAWRCGLSAWPPILSCLWPAMPPRALASLSATRCFASERVALFCPAYVALGAVTVTEHVCPPIDPPPHASVPVTIVPFLRVDCV
jgi:hypothetical protein